MTRPHAHTPLHLIQPGPVHTAGRLTRADPIASGRLALSNAHAHIELALPPHIEALKPSPGQLVRVDGAYDGQRLHAQDLRVAGTAQDAANAPRQRERPTQLARAMRARARMSARCAAFFASRHFLPVQTPCLVPEPGTDVYLEPFATAFIPDGEVTSHHATGSSPGALPMYLQTSPELAMKRMLGQGFERIWQLTRAWRNGEVTRRHVPEFAILEWYRAWEGVEAIMEDVEALTRQLLDGRAMLAVGEQPREFQLDRPFERITMQALFERACGFDLLDALDYPRLYEESMARGLIGPTFEPPGDAAPSAPSAQASWPAPDERWAALFYDLQVAHLDPLLDEMGPVFVTHWPAPLAVLAQRSPQDPRVCERFELYVGGLELANGFGELTDANEQRARFGQDLSQRQALGRPPYPLPERFLGVLERGMPPSAGVAMGFDRLLMLAMGASEIRQVCPFQLTRQPHAGQIEWSP